MRLALTHGAAFIGGEMGHRRDLCSSHTLCGDQRATWMHLMMTPGHTHTLTPIRTHARTGPGARTNKKAGSLVNMQHRERAVLSCCVDLSLMISLNSTRNMMSFDRPVVTRL